MRAEIRLRHPSLRTEQACIDRARRYIHFHDKRHPQESGAEGGAGFSVTFGEPAQGVGFDAKPSQRRCSC